MDGMASQPGQKSIADFAPLDDFLAAFFSTDEPLHLRAFKAKGAGDMPQTRPRKLQLTRRQLARGEQLQQLIELNDHLGIYFVVNAGGDTDKEIRRFTAFFCERDDISIAEQHRLLNAAPLAPSIRVETRKSVHAYWLIAGECREDEWRDGQARLIAYFNGDASIKNPSRVMRLPCFNHLSLTAEGGYQTKRVELAGFAPQRRYTVAEMMQAFPAVQLQAAANAHASAYQADSYTNWAALKAELGRRVMAHPTARRNLQGKWDARGLCHNGAGDSGLFFDPSSNFTHCNKGCDQAAILRAFGLPERPNGNQTATPQPAIEPQTDSLASFRVVCLADIQDEEVNWLWHPRIPLGKITILEGDPGLGKSWLTCALATAAQGDGLPGMARTEPRNVLMLSAEDGLRDTIRPRLGSMNADMSRIFVSEGALTLDEAGCLILEAAIVEHQAALVTIDPIVAYTGAQVDLHRANESREVMARLARIAERQKCALVALRHLTKGGQGKALYRGLGSIDLTAAARSVLLVGADPDNGDERGIVQTKNNLAPMAGPVGYELRDGQFFWSNSSTLTAERILSGGGYEEPVSRLKAEEFLREVLRDGAKQSKEIVKEALNAGISKRTLDRAKNNLNIRSCKQTYSGSWLWELPPQDCQLANQDCQTQKVGNLGQNTDDKLNDINHLLQDCQVAEVGNHGGNLGYEDYPQDCHSHEVGNLGVND